MLGQTSDVAVGIVSLFISLGLYFLPTIVALSRRGPNSGSVTLINLLLGWTVIGWLVALAMAVKPKHPQLPDLPRPPRGAFPRSDHGRKPGLAQSREPAAGSSGPARRSRRVWTSRPLPGPGPRSPSGDLGRRLPPSRFPRGCPWRLHQRSSRRRLPHGRAAGSSGPARSLSRISPCT